MPAGGGALLPAETIGSQRLFRVRYQGPDGGGNLRLVLRLAAADRFRIDAADPLGRALWSLSFESGGATIVDHRRREYCSSGRSIRVPEVALAALPIEALPSVLLGLLPTPPPEGAAVDGRLDFEDADGQRWTARLEGGAPRSWTSWSAGEPLLWWQSQPRGGVLSHRRGAQFRWRQTVSEPLSEEVITGEPPAAYGQVGCDDWHLPELRQDQPPPAGDRPAQ